MKSLLFIGSLLCTFSTEVGAKAFWTEKDPSSPALVNLPNLGPVIDQVDAAVVNIATSSEPKQERRRPVDPRQQPMDPFSNPEDFFERFFGNPFREEQGRQPRRSLGSGFIISKDGYIVTNNHVVDGADKIEVTIFSEESPNGRIPREGNKLDAKIVGRDPATDIALIKITPSKDLSYVPLGNSTRLRKGDWVLAFGNPFGLDHSVSLGIISASGREISPNENRRFDDFLQTDAAINFGNSGGPLVNLKGEVVGVNTAITAQGSGIGFAVPVNILKEVLPNLKDNGSVVRGYLGVMIQDVTDEMKEALGLKEAKGVLVNDIVADGPASKSQLKRGDVIVKVDGNEVSNGKELQRNVAKIKPGTNVNVDLIREKKAMKISVKIGALPSEGPEVIAEGEATKADKLGLAVGAIPDSSGVMVQDIAENSAAAQAGILPGDIIRQVNGTAIKTVDQYTKLISALKSKQTVLIDLERKNIKLFVAFRVP